MIHKPIIFNLTKKEDLNKFNEIIETSNIDIIDKYKSLLNELYKVQSLHKEGYIEDVLETTSAKKSERWIYYPWLNKIIHTLDENSYFLLRTARNKNLITTQEQENFKQFNVGIIGLSVGQNSALAIARSGGANNMKLIDNDIIELTNLNRLNSNIFSIGQSKVEACSNSIYELNPYANIIALNEKLTQKNIGKFINSPFKLDVIIDAFDDIKLKIIIRREAKKEKIPLIMATDCANGVLIDIERYDLDPSLPLFHGILTEEVLQEMELNNAPELLIKRATQIISAKHFSKRMQDSLLNVGKELSGVPQLGIASYMAGAVVAYIVKKLANKEKLSVNRKFINLDKMFDLNYNKKTSKVQRKLNQKDFMKLLDIDD